MIARAAPPDLKVGPTYTVLAIAAILCGDGVRAQVARPAPPLARVDAIAADARGQAVTGLTADDFEVIENGAPRRIESVSFMADQATRLVAIYLDEYHVSAGPGVARVQAALARFIDHLLDPRDLLAIVRPLDSLPGIQLTPNRAIARDALSRFAPRKGDYEPRNAFERTYIASDPRRIDTVRAQIALSGLNALANRLGGLKAGRKTLIVISEGFTRGPRRRGDEGTPSADTVVRSANRGGVSIYPIDPRAFDVSGGSTTDTAGHELLHALAAETDGRVLLNPIDAPGGVDGVVARVMADLNGYYLISFEPSASAAAGGFHPVQVSVRRTGVELRSRRSYWSPVPAPSAAAAPSPPLRVLPPLTPRPSALVRASFAMSPGPHGDDVQIFWEPAPRLPNEFGRPRIPARVGFRVYELRAGASASQDVDPIVTGTSDDRRAARFALAPGSYRVQMSILDANANLLESDVRDFVVPGRATDAAIGTPQVWRARDARGSADNDPQALPVVVRDFRRAERLLIRLPVYPAGLRVSAQLTNERGELVRQPAVGVGPSPSELYLDVALAGLADGGYQLDFVAAAEGGRARESLTFRVLP
jgi:VWFA-related protein